MTSIDRAANAIATILIREGIDYLQSKAVIKRARAQAGLSAPPEKRTSINRLTVEEELVFIDHAYEASGATGLLLQTLLETGLRVSEFTRLRVEVDDPSLVDEPALKAAGAFGVVQQGTSVQVVVGPEADTLAEDIEDLR